ncbi:MAG TPA: hypothetical protein VLK89_00195 [Solirubrobacterales bacterium]|nr:hypothetical protein [Solirubrobacterales bacterium]
MSKRPAGALAGIVVILFLATPAIGAVRRDTVIETPSVGSARISASETEGRYPIDDGSGETVAIDVTAACQTACTAADPQSIANFLGTLIHGPEMELLTVQLDTPSQIEFDCGYGAQACYYGGENKIVLSGSDAIAPDGASREFVLAHEYGHHVAQHRENTPPFPAAIDWGPPRWSSYEGVCQRSKTGALFPGNEGLHYFQDPGEAFAESFAHYRFPEADVQWRWLPALKPSKAAFEAIRMDTLHPWAGRSAFQLAGRLPTRGQGATVESFRTPLDGTVSLRPAGGPRYDLSLLNPAGHVLRTARHGRDVGRRLNYTVCGQSRLRVAVRSSRRASGAFKLQVQRP